MKSIVNNHARRSGRTYRMIEDAIKCCINDKRKVYILCDEPSLEYNKSMAYQICRRNGIKLPESIKFETISSLGSRNIDWHNTTLMGAHSNCKLFIDHHVYAKQFGFAIDGFFKYDFVEGDLFKIPPECDFSNLI